MEDVKFVICSVVSGVLSLLVPIKDFMIAMIIVFSLNYLFGWVAGMVHGESWSFKKSMVFFYHCTLFFVLTSALFVTGHFMHNEGETLGVVKALCGTMLRILREIGKSCLLRVQRCIRLRALSTTF